MEVTERANVIELVRIDPREKPLHMDVQPHSHQPGCAASG